MDGTFITLRVIAMTPVFLLLSFSDRIDVTARQVDARITSSIERGRE